MLPEVPEILLVRGRSWFKQDFLQTSGYDFLATLVLWIKFKENVLINSCANLVKIRR